MSFSSMIIWFKKLGKIEMKDEKMKRREIIRMNRIN